MEHFFDFDNCGGYGLRGHHLKLKVHRCMQTPVETGFLQSASDELVEYVAVISDRGDICQHVQDASGRLDAECGHLKLELLSTTLQVQELVKMNNYTVAHTQKPKGTNLILNLLHKSIKEEDAFPFANHLRSNFFT